MHDLLEKLFAIGEEMLIQLSEDNLDKFYSLLGDRQDLIHQINSKSEKSASSQDHSEKFASIDNQFKAIIKQLRVKEQALFENLKQLQNLKQAQQSYHFDRKPRRFLRSNLSG